MRLDGDHTDAVIHTAEDDIDDMAKEQIQRLIDHRAFQQPVRIMPDFHAGKGCVIGFTMPLGDATVPNTIGVDIGCGMYAFKLPDGIPMSHSQLDERIRDRIPFGKNANTDELYDMDTFPWDETTAKFERFMESYERTHGSVPDIDFDGYDKDYFDAVIEKVDYDKDRAIASIGSLGGGNHFIEFGEDSDGDIWCIIHSGSRGFGYHIADYWQNRATDLRERKIDKEYTDAVDRVREQYEGERIQEEIDKLREEYALDRDETLDWLTGKFAFGYYIDMILAQTYASESRKEMARRIQDILGIEEPAETIESVHNYIDFDDMVIRKGATRAHDDEKLIIPFNMAAGTLICKGKGNEDWNRSAPHGAGRVMSRRQAHDDIDVEAFKERMDGVFSTSVNENTLDEAPQAYKDAAVVEDAITETATIVDRLKPIHNLKAE